jgi:hypothetical protein
MFKNVALHENSVTSPQHHFGLTSRRVLGAVLIPAALATACTGPKHDQTAPVPTVNTYDCVTGYTGLSKSTNPEMTKASASYVPEFTVSTPANTLVVGIAVSGLGASAKLLKHGYHLHDRVSDTNIDDPVTFGVIALELSTNITTMTPQELDTLATSDAYTVTLEQAMENCSPIASYYPETAPTAGQTA